MKAEIYNHHDWIEETKPDKLQHYFKDLLQQSGFEILGFMEHHFSPQGYTAIWLLGESHFAIHTFPEENKSYIELSSCDRAMYEKFLEYFRAQALSLNQQ